MNKGVVLAIGIIFALLAISILVQHYTRVQTAQKAATSSQQFLINECMKQKAMVVSLSKLAPFPNGTSPVDRYNAQCGNYTGPLAAIQSP
jgi:uncharacterized membrane protein